MHKHNLIDFRTEGGARGGVNQGGKYKGLCSLQANMCTRVRVRIVGAAHHVERPQTISRMLSLSSSCLLEHDKISVVLQSKEGEHQREERYASNRR